MRIIFDSTNQNYRALAIAPTTHVIFPACVVISIVCMFNLQKMGKKDGEEGEGSFRVAIEILEKEKKLMEEAPDAQLEDKTKRLRQACFKANYKKRKLMAGSNTNVMASRSSTTYNYSSSTASSNNPPSMDAAVVAADFGTRHGEEEEEELKTLYIDYYSSSDVIF